jgi:hypothetical protein
MAIPVSVGTRHGIESRSACDAPISDPSSLRTGGRGRSGCRGSLVRGTQGWFGRRTARGTRISPPDHRSRPRSFPRLVTRARRTRSGVHSSRGFPTPSSFSSGQRSCACWPWRTPNGDPATGSAGYEGRGDWSRAWPRREQRGRVTRFARIARDCAVAE